MEHGTAAAKIHLDEQGRIDGLWFGAPQTDKAESLDDIMKEMGGLPGKVSALVLEDGKPLASVHPDDALGVGSAFKLAILAAAQEQVAAGKRRLDEVHPLDKRWKPLPSGSLQNWPDGTPLTVATLENQMISMSDNTAADGMLSIVGRGEAQKFAPGNKPFLSTREAFVLKARTNEALLDRYRKADENGRRAMLAEIDTLPLPDLGEFSGAAQATDIEWFFTANEMCALMAKVADADAMHINPGLAKAAQWKQIAFKEGGSEGGVLNLTTGLTGQERQALLRGGNLEQQRAAGAGEVVRDLRETPERPGEDLGAIIRAMPQIENCWQGPILADALSAKVGTVRFSLIDLGSARGQFPPHEPPACEPSSILLSASTSARLRARR